MKFREMVKKVQMYSGFSDRESQEALECMVESLATHLTEGERKDFASQLPTELKNIALTVEVTEEDTKKNILQQFMEAQNIDESRAKKQMMTAWKAIKEAISPGEIQDIKAQLPNDMAAMLY